MDERLLRALIEEMAHQTRCALMAYQDLQEADAALYRDPDRIWYSVRSFIVAAGMISRILWPSDRAPQRRKQQRQNLRTFLKIGEEHPLKDRALRNHFEHFDERLERWAEDHNASFPLDRLTLGRIHSVRESHSNNIMRRFHRGSKTVIMWGDEVAIEPALESIIKLRRSLAEALDRLRRHSDAEESP